MQFDPSLRDFHKKAQASYLSSDQNDRQSYRGFANLVLIVAIVGNIRNIVENVSKHGNFLAQALKFNASLEAIDYYVMGATAALPVFVVASFLIEKAGATPYLSNFATKILQTLNVSASLLVPCAICHYTQANPVVCGPLVFGSTVLFLKLVSYGHTNAVLRERWMSMPPRDGKDAEIPSSYPNNLSLYDITRFLAFPTLCYQTSYPRTSKIRKKVRRRV